jgi:von Willebrand factor type A domain
LFVLSAALPLAALALTERRSRVLRRFFSLTAPRRRELGAAAFALTALPALLAVAVAQPVVVHRQSVTQRSDSEAFIVFDTSQSMSARSSLHSPTRLERAEQEAKQILPQFGDIPVGLATMTDRVLPNLMPTTNDALIDRTIDQSIGINEPPPSELYPRTATSLSVLARIPAFRLFSQSASEHSILVVFTDGESAPLEPGVGWDLVQPLTKIPPLFVHMWAPGERIYLHGRVDPRYQSDPQSGAVLQQFAKATHGAVFGENDLSALVQKIHSEAGPMRTETTLLAYSRVPLGPWLLVAGVLPLGFLFWRRNL